MSKFCVRRVMGVIGYMSCIFAMFMDKNHESLQALLIASTALLGITTIDKFIKT